MIEFGKQTILVIFVFTIIIFIAIKILFGNKGRCNFRDKPICYGELSCEEGTWKCSKYNIKLPSQPIDIGCTSSNKPDPTKCKHPICVGNKWKCTTCTLSNMPPPDCDRPICVDDKWICLSDYTKPMLCNIHDKNLVGCPDGNEVICINGQWKCGTTCSPDKILSDCSPFQQVCDNGEWKCITEECSADAPECPNFSNLLCVDGEWTCDGCDPDNVPQDCSGILKCNSKLEWQCISKTTDYFGGILNTLSLGSGGIQSIYLFPGRCLFENGIIGCITNTIPILFSDENTDSFRKQNSSGFGPVLDENQNIIFQQLYYSAAGLPSYYFTPIYWYPSINPSPEINLDLYFSDYVNSTANHACTIYLSMFDADELNNGNLKIITSTIIYTGTTSDLNINYYKPGGYSIITTSTTLKDWTATGTPPTNKIKVGFLIYYFYNKDPVTDGAQLLYSYPDNVKPVNGYSLKIYNPNV